MTTASDHRVGEVIRWTARLWSFPLIAMTFLLALGPFIRLPSIGVVGALSSLYAMAVAVAFVVAWHHESVGGWIALTSALVFKVWFTIRMGHFPVGPFDLVLLLPAILFLFSASLHGASTKARMQDPKVDGSQTQTPMSNRFFALPTTRLGWSSLLIGSGCFVFMRLFWMQAYSPDRDRSTFFSDPVNAACLIGAFAFPIVGMILALVAIVWKRERSIFLAPLLLLGLFALLWAIAVGSGANA